MASKVIAFLLLVNAVAFGQAARYDSFTWTIQGTAGLNSPLFSVPGAAIHVCDYPANATPCTNYASIYSDPELSVPIAQPGMVSDSYSNFGFYAAPGDYEYTVTYNGVSSGPYPVFLGAVSGSNINFKSINTIQYADQFTGANWCVQIMAADTALGASGGEIWVNNNVASMAACTVDVALSANHTLRFIQSGTYTLGTHHIAPAGIQTRVLCGNWGTVLDYSGTGYPYDVVTQARSVMDGCFLQIGTLAAGGVRYQHITSSSEANNRMTHTFIYAPVYSASQIGVLFYNTSLTDSNFHNDIEVQTFQLGVGAKFLSTVNNNGANANILHIKTNLQGVGVDIPDGTDESIHVSCLGAHGLTNGICARLGGTGGGYGATDNNVWIEQSEQGGTSTTISYVTGASINAAYGISADSTAVSDTSGVLNNRSFIGGLMVHPIVVSTCLPFGSAESAASAAVCHSGTTLRARLGDDSDYAPFQAAAGKFTGLSLTNLLSSSTAPTISSGFGTSPTVASNNGTAAFTINVGTGGTATNGVIGLPTATNGWNCTCNDITTNSSTVFLCKQKASATTTATIANFNTSATEAAWIASDIVQVSCSAR